MEQWILVKGSGSEGMLYLAEARPEWRILYSCPAVLGLGGMGKSREGDDRTPVGVFRVKEAYGILPDPGCRIPYTRVTPDMYWCGDSRSPDYNRLTRASGTQPPGYGEHLADYVPEYHYLVDIGYNEEREPGRGSGIFLHCRGKKDYTHGCVAVEETDMARILRWLRPGAFIWIEEEKQCMIN